jgi:uncharacterized membrane protein YGL010W
MTTETFVALISSSCKVLILSVAQSLTVLYICMLKVVLVAQLFCWIMQFIGHGVFEVSLSFYLYLALVI